MEFTVNEIVLRPGESESLVKKRAAKKLSVPEDEISDIVLTRKSVDARKKGDILFRCSAIIYTGGDKRKEERIAERRATGGKKICGRPVVVGAGPCGLYAAFILAQAGLSPLLLERGKRVEERAGDIDALKKSGILNKESNICFGEGGAGAFSDGKLTARNKSRYNNEVLSLMVENGADPSILYLAKPHLGTEVVRKVFSGIRKQAESLGAETVFGAKLTEVLTKDGEVCGVAYEKDGERLETATNAVVLAIGHSARDTIASLLNCGIVVEKKAFAVGARIEHSREFIDRAQYGSFAGDRDLGSAEYFVHTQAAGRGVYSFCMCPGGEVVCSATEDGMTAVNGMSYAARNMANSNSAIVATVGLEDIGGGATGGIELQREIERAVYDMAGGFGAVCERAADFAALSFSGKASAISSSYKPYVKYGPLHECFPAYIRDAISGGLKVFDRQIKGFMSEGLLVGAETRTSSPFRITREDTMNAAGVKGLYPAGEGAGYAGGIVSSAIDGLRAADMILEVYGK